MWTRALVLTLALTGACNSTPGSTAMPADSGSTDTSATPGAALPQPGEGLRVAVALSQDTVREGETLRVTVTVTNTGPARRTINATSGCFTDFEIVDASDQVVATSEQMCAAVMAQRELDPGQSFEETQTWVRGLRGMPVVPPGSYRVRGVLLAQEGAVRSEPVPLTVTPS